MLPTSGFGPAHVISVVFATPGDLQAAEIAQPNLRLGSKLDTGPGIELFQYDAREQQPPAFTSDLGWQHVAIYVDDLEASLARAEAAGGDVLNETWDLRNDEAGAGARVAFVRAPFGAIFELITYPAPLLYEQKTAFRRWKPPAA